MRENIFSVDGSKIIDTDVDKKMSLMPLYLYMSLNGCSCYFSGKFSYSDTLCHT